MKQKKAKASKANSNHQALGEINNESDLKTFLLNVRDKMVEQVAAPIFAVSALNQILSNPDLYKYLNEENKELSRDIWLRIKQSGYQMTNPPMLFAGSTDK